MAIPIKCAGCQAAFDVPESLSGKTIRCTSCKTELKVQAPAAKPAAPVAKAAQPAKPASAATKTAVKTAAKASPAPADASKEKTRPIKSTAKSASKRRDDDDDDEDDDEEERPAKKGKGKKKAKGGSNMPLIIGGGVGVLAIIGLAIFLLTGSSKDKKATASNSSSSSPGSTMPTGGPPGGAGNGAPAGWKVTEVDGITFALPSISKTEEKTSAGLRVQMFGYETADKKGGMMFMITSPPPGKQFKQDRDTLKKSLAGFFSKAGISARNRRETSLGSAPAEEFQFAKGGQSMTAKAVVANNRFVLAFYGSETDPSGIAADGAKFLASISVKGSDSPGPNEVAGGPGMIPGGPGGPPGAGGNFPGPSGSFPGPGGPGGPGGPPPGGGNFPGPGGPGGPPPGPGGNFPGPGGPGGPPPGGSNFPGPGTIPGGPGGPPPGPGGNFPGPSGNFPRPGGPGGPPPGGSNFPGPGAPGTIPGGPGGPPPGPGGKFPGPSGNFPGPGTIPGGPGGPPPGAGGNFPGPSGNFPRPGGGFPGGPPPGAGGAFPGGPGGAFPGGPGGFNNGNGNGNGNRPPAGAATRPKLARKIEPFYAFAFDTEMKEVYTIGTRMEKNRVAGRLYRYSYPDFRPKAEYKLPYVATRAAIDAKRGILYLATATNRSSSSLQKLWNEANDRATAYGDLQIVQLEPIRSGKAADGSELKPTTVQINGLIRGLELSPDNKHLFVGFTKTTNGGGRPKSYVRKYDTADRKMVKELVLPQQAFDMRKSADGSKLLIIEDGSAGNKRGDRVQIMVCDAGSMELGKPIRAPGMVTDIAPHPDSGIMMALAGTEQGSPSLIGGKLQWLDTTSFESTEIVESGWMASNNNYVNFSPDGKHLFVSSVAMHDRSRKMMHPGVDVYVPDKKAPGGYKKVASIHDAIRVKSAELIGGFCHITPDNEMVVFHSGTVLDMDGLTQNAPNADSVPVPDSGGSGSGNQGGVPGLGGAGGGVPGVGGPGGAFPGGPNGGAFPGGPNGGAFPGRPNGGAFPGRPGGRFPGRGRRPGGVVPPGGAFPGAPGQVPGAPPGGAFPGAPGQVPGAPPGGAFPGAPGGVPGPAPGGAFPGAPGGVPGPAPGGAFPGAPGQVPGGAAPGAPPRGRK